MVCKLFIFRHAETLDNSHGVFSGWRDSNLTPKGVGQAQEIAKQLNPYPIDYAFTSHLMRARKTLEIVLEGRASTSVFVDDRLIERCYGLFQGKDKWQMERDDPEWYAKIHRGYSFVPPGGESLEMVERRVTSFLEQLREWLKVNPGNVAISCHNNSIRPLRRVFDNLSVAQMCSLESSQDCALVYEVEGGDFAVRGMGEAVGKPSWKGVLVPEAVELAWDVLNPLRVYYK
ncbi:MAG: histidine phosphatase family protein [Candidatus Bathyarchaeia archaeon]|jgi:2,3-bisphosphoglycerate-dependent phosphoglycerate mutase